MIHLVGKRLFFTFLNFRHWLQRSDSSVNCNKCNGWSFGDVLGGL